MPDDWGDMKPTDFSKASQDEPKPPAPVGMTPQVPPPPTDQVDDDTFIDPSAAELDDLAREAAAAMERLEDTAVDVPMTPPVDTRPTPDVPQSDPQVPRPPPAAADESLDPRLYVTSGPPNITPDTGTSNSLPPTREGTLGQKLNLTPRELRQQEAEQGARDRVEVEDFERGERPPPTTRNRIQTGQNQEQRLQDDLQQRLKDLEAIAKAGSRGEIDLGQGDMQRVQAEFGFDGQRLKKSVRRELDLIDRERDAGVGRRRAEVLDERQKELERQDRGLSKLFPDERGERRSSRGERSEETSGPEGDATTPAGQRRGRGLEQVSDRDGDPGGPAPPAATNPPAASGGGQSNSPQNELDAFLKDWLSGKLAEDIAGVVIERLRQQ